MLIELTHPEAQSLVNLLNTAVKAVGLEAAMAAVPLVHKIQKAANDAADEGAET